MLFSPIRSALAGAVQPAFNALPSAAPPPAPPVTVTWDPANKGYDTALSEGDLVVTASLSGNIMITRSTVARSAGKQMFELTPLSHSSDGILAVGLAKAAWDATDVAGYLGTNANSIGIYTNGGAYTNGSDEINNGSTIPDFANAPTDVLTLALNFDTGKVWMAVNGTFVGDPAAGTGEAFTFTPNTEWYVAVSGFGSVTADSVRANFGASAFTATLPSGWSSWDGSQTA
ncbi:MAG: hypothetical protein V4669_13670 [Pseudomonadota bacterium]